MSVQLRPLLPTDAEPCSRILFDAFQGIAARHNFPPDLPTLADAAQFATMFIQHPHIHGVAAERDGRLVGCNFLDERDAIAVATLSASACCRTHTTWARSRSTPGWASIRAR
jgi:hypothetical protein